MENLYTFDVNEIQIFKFVLKKTAWILQSQPIYTNSICKHICDQNCISVLQAESFCQNHLIMKRRGHIC